jgi:hypothetical protein
MPRAPYTLRDQGQYQRVERNTFHLCVCRQRGVQALGGKGVSFELIFNIFDLYK